MVSMVDWLEKTRTVDILVSLLNGKKYFSELKDVTGGASTSTIESRIKELSKVGLVKDKKEDKFGGRRYIWLTEKGEKVASLLAEIEKIMKTK
jgi:DNA-binding HxlR family transcriptional regulator